VDVGRQGTTRTSSMRIFRDDLAIEVPVRWYYVPDDRRVLPYATPFGNRDWEFADGDPGLLLGEVYGSRRYYGGQDPVGVLAQGLCGTQQQWERGPSLLDPVRPLNPTTGRQCCCGRGTLLGTPGVALGAESTIEELPITTLCPDWVPSPLHWDLTMAGWTNAVCSNCNNLNSTFRLTFTGGDATGCFWQLIGAVVLCGTMAGLRLQWNHSLDNWLLFVIKPGAPSPTNHYIWGLTGAAWNRWGPNTLGLVISGSACANPPATVTLTKGW